MATMDDLFGGGGAKSAPQPKWINVDDVHVGVITDEPSVIDVRDYVSKKVKFMVKTGGGAKGWEIKLDGEFDTNLENFRLKQIKVPVTLTDGAAATFYFDGQKREALKAEMEKTGIALVPGTTVAVKLVAEQATQFGSKKKIHAVRLAEAS